MTPAATDGLKAVLHELRFMFDIAVVVSVVLVSGGILCCNLIWFNTFSLLVSLIVSLCLKHILCVLTCVAT